MTGTRAEARDNAKERATAKSATKTCRTCRVALPWRSFYETTSGFKADCYPCDSSNLKKKRRDLAARLALLEHAAGAARDYVALPTLERLGVMGVALARLDALGGGSA